MTCLTVTHLRVDYRTSESPPPYPDVKYLIVNCCFKIDQNQEDGWPLWHQAKGESEEYTKNLSIDDPEEYEKWLFTERNWLKKYPGHSHVWVHQDQTWQYIEKFDTFVFREWIADSPITRAIIAELQFYKNHGKLPTVYRGTDESTVLRHLRTLNNYWD